MPTAIITGASRGLGYALAAQLAAAGWSLVLDARGADALTEAADTLRATRPGRDAVVAAAPGAPAPTAVIEAIAGDITSADHRAELIRAAVALGGLDLLINNAGILGPSPLPSTADLSAADLREIIEVNVVAPLALTQAALPLLRASGGALIDITSDAAVEAYPGWGGYGAAKAATEQLRNVLAAEEAEGGTWLTVWRVDPGDLRTEMHQLAFPDEDISDRPLPSSVAPGLLGLLAARPASGRYRLADFLPGSPAPDAAVPGVPGSPALDAAVPTRPRDPAVEAGPVALWLTVEVDDYEPAAAFYRDVLGLPEVETWATGGEVGAVYAVGPTARIEVERPADPVPHARAAIEYPDLDALTTAYDRIAAHAATAGHSGPTPVLQHGRGHSGFTVYDPRGTEIYLWTEK